MINQAQEGEQEKDTVLQRAIRIILRSPHKHEDFLRQVLEDEMQFWSEDDLRSTFIEGC